MKLMPLALLLASCVTTSPVMNNTNIENIDFSDIDQWTRGTACAIYVLCFIGPFGKGTIAEAISVGTIKHVKLVEETQEFYGLACQMCTIVYGTTKDMERNKKE